MCACGSDKRPGFRQCCGSLKLPFRLRVRKMKCGDCDLLVLVEHASQTTLHLQCPVCTGSMELMDIISIKEEK